MFTTALLTWFDLHGRHHLPWQKNKDPYRVWLSEVMLQQTQVITVIPYFEKFITQFPTLSTLANAHEDEVLALWSGLGYYSRARNLHKTSQIIESEYNGLFPDNAEELVKLPGIGASTAHAILSIVWNQPLAILDGNVKRVLTRYHGIVGSPYQSEIEKKLWLIAQKHMSTNRAGDYTQAIMDFGATLCTRSKPLCEICPLAITCVAKQKNLQRDLPTKKTKVIKPEKETDIFLIKNKNNEILLEKRESKGLWGGLWTLPGSNSDVFATQLHVPSHLKKRPLINFRHTFSHFHLDINAISLNAWPELMLNPNQQWFSLHSALTLGLPRAVEKILKVSKC